MPARNARDRLDRDPPCVHCCCACDWHGPADFNQQLLTRQRSSMQLSKRAGKASGFLALGLFLLSCLVVVPALKWTTQGRRSSQVTPRHFQFSDDFQATHDKGPLVKLTPQIKAWHYVADLETEIAQFDTVFWEPDDTSSLRHWLSQSSLDGQHVLEIGTGTGLVALVCAHGGATRVVATDINVNAFANAGYNAEHLGLDSRLEFRLVAEDDPGPFAVVDPTEQFDLILSNPPWEDADVNEPAAYALYDPGFGLLDGILDQADQHLNQDGKLLLAYGAKTAIQRIIDTAPQHGWSVEVSDNRDLEELPEVFVPGMLLILTREPQ